MWGCQLALAEAHVPTSVSLLPILSSSCLCFATPKKRATFRTQKWVAIQLEAQLTNSWLLFWADGLGGCLSVKRALNCDNERRSSMVFVRLVAKMLVSQYICLTNLIIASISFTLAQKKAQGCPKKTHRWRSQDLPRDPSWTKPGWFQPWRGRTGQSGCRRRLSPSHSTACTSCPGLKTGLGNWGPKQTGFREHMGISWRYHRDIPKTSIISPILLTIPLKTLFWSEFDHWKCQWWNWTEPQNSFCCWVARLDSSIFWWLGHDCIPHPLPWLMSSFSPIKLHFYWAILYFLLVVHTKFAYT